MKKITPVIIFLFVISIAIAGVPNNIPTGIRIWNSSGNLLDKDGVTINLSIFNTASEGDYLLSQVNVTNIDNGTIPIMLDDVNLSFDEQYYLEIAIDGNTMPERIAFGSTPYSIRANFSYKANNTDYFNGSLASDYVSKTWLTTLGYYFSDENISGLGYVKNHTSADLTLINGTANYLTLGCGNLTGGQDDLCFVNDTIDDKLSTVTYYAWNISNIGGGTLNAGNISSINTSDDGEVFNVTEGGGASPLTIIINFTGVKDFDRILANWWYEGGQGHEIYIGVYEPDDNEYEEEYGAITDMNGFEFELVNVLDPSSHMTADGNVSVRLRHDQNGITSHNFFIDYLVLRSGFASVTVSAHDALTGRDNDANHPQYVLTDGGREMTQLNISGTLNVTGKALFNSNSYIENGTDAHFSYVNITTLNVTGVSSLGSVTIETSKITTENITAQNAFLNVVNMSVLNVTNDVVSIISAGDIQLGSDDIIDFSTSATDKIHFYGSAFGIGMSGNEMNTWVQSGSVFSWRENSREGEEHMRLSVATGDLLLTTGELYSNGTGDNIFKGNLRVSGDNNNLSLGYGNITDWPTCAGDDYLTFDGSSLTCDTPSVAGGASDANVESNYSVLKAFIDNNKTKTDGDIGNNYTSLVTQIINANTSVRTYTDTRITNNFTINYNNLIGFNATVKAWILSNFTASLAHIDTNYSSLVTQITDANTSVRTYADTRITNNFTVNYNNLIGFNATVKTWITSNYTSALTHIDNNWTSLVTQIINANTSVRTYTDTHINDNVTKLDNAITQNISTVLDNGTVDAHFRSMNVTYLNATDFIITNNMSLGNASTGTLTIWNNGSGICIGSC